MGAYVVSQSHFKITVEDGTMIEVKIDKAKKSTIGIVHLLQLEELFYLQHYLVF